MEYDFSFLDKTFTMFLRVSICVNRAYSCKYWSLVIIGSRQFICYGCLHRRNRILDRNDNSRASTQSLYIGFLNHKGKLTSHSCAGHPSLLTIN